MINIVMGFFKRHRSAIECLAVVLLYASITLVSVLRHEPVPDEANYWVMARDAKSLAELYHLIPWAAHPILWNLILFFLSHAGLSILSAALLNWAIMVVAVSIIFLRSPFSRFVKYAIIFSFYIFFEYAVFARNYGIAVLFLFMAAWLYPRRFIHPIRYGAVLFLLFHTHYLVFPLASALAAVFFFEGAIRLYHRRMDFLIGAFLMAGGGIVVFFSGFSIMDICQGLFVPAGHWSHYMGWAGNMGVLADAIGRAFVPICEDLSRAATCFLGSVLIGIVTLALVRKRTLFLVFVFYVATLLFSFFVVIPTSANRHFSFIQMGMIFVLWVSFFYEDRPYSLKALQWANRINTARLRKIALLMLAFILLASARTTIRGHWYEWRYVFSGGQEMAVFIQDILQREVGEKDTVVIFPIINTLPLVAALPSKSTWAADSQSPGTFFSATWDDFKNTEVTKEEVVRRVKEKFGDLSRTLLVFDTPLPFEQALGYQFLLLKAIFSPEYGYMGNYMFFLYKPIPVSP